MLDGAQSTGLLTVDGSGALAGYSPLALRFMYTVLREPFVKRQANQRAHRCTCALLNLSKRLNVLRFQKNLKPLKW